MSDKLNQIITAALRRAAGQPAGVRLHGKPPGLFPPSEAGKKAAQLCKSEAWIRTVRTEGHGRSLREICAITEKGLAYLFDQVSPKHVLEDLVRALHSQQNQVGQLLATARHWQINIDACKALVERAFRTQSESAWHIGANNGKANDVAGAKHQQPSLLGQAILTQLNQWMESDVNQDCPLPELFRSLQVDRLTIGQFHDQLRELQEQGRIYLHPWTGPLPEIPEPAFALLAGHGIAYYASINQKSEIRNQMSDEKLCSLTSADL